MLAFTNIFIKISKKSQNFFTKLNFGILELNKDKVFLGDGEEVMFLETFKSH